MGLSFRGAPSFVYPASTARKAGGRSSGGVDTAWPELPRRLDATVDARRYVDPSRLASTSTGAPLQKKCASAAAASSAVTTSSGSFCFRFRAPVSPARRWSPVGTLRGLRGSLTSLVFFFERPALTFFQLLDILFACAGVLQACRCFRRRAAACAPESPAFAAERPAELSLCHVLQGRAASELLLSPGDRVSIGFSCLVLSPTPQSC